MNRLTKDLKTPHNDTGYSDIVKNSIDREQIVLTKLKMYEDLEEELDCPLEVVIKALKEGIVLNNDILYKCKLSYIRKELIFVCYINTTAVTGVSVKDYNKTWWLEGEKDVKEEN